MNRSSVGLLLSMVLGLMLCSPTNARAAAEECKCGAASCLRKEVKAACVTAGVSGVCTTNDHQCNYTGSTATDVLCGCENSSSSLTVEPDSLNFPTIDLSSKTTSESRTFEISAPGSDLFVDVKQPSKPFAALPSASFQGLVMHGSPEVVDVVFTPSGVGEFKSTVDISKVDTESDSSKVDIDSDAAIGAQSATVALSGMAVKSVPVVPTGASVEVAWNTETGDFGLVYSHEDGSIWGTISSNDGTSWGKAVPLVGAGNHTRAFITSATWAAPGAASDQSGDNGGPLSAATVSPEFLVAYTDFTKGDTVKAFTYTPGVPVPTPKIVTSGFVQSLTTGGGYYFLGVATSGGVALSKSTNGSTWTTLSNIPFNPDDLIGDANVAYAGDTLAFAWTDQNFSTEATKRLLSTSNDLGRTWSKPLTLHTFKSSEAGAYFDPTLFFFGSTLCDFGEAIDSTTTTVFVDYLTAGATTTKDQQIGGTGLQGGFGVVFDNSTLVAIAIDTSHDNTLNLFTGPLGGKLTGGPIGTETGVQEARIFPAGGNKFLISIVQNSEPGPVSVIQGQL